MQNLKCQYAPSINYESLNSDFFRYFAKEDGWLTEFKKTKEFEDKLSGQLQIEHCHTTNNGTISLSIALLAVGVKAGDEVLVPNLTMIATINAVTLIGAVPVLVDVEVDTLCMDMKKAKEKLSRFTTAMIYVAYNGRFGNVDKVLEFSMEHDLPYIEDNAQAMFSQYHNGEFIGTHADIASYSFSPQKIITTGQGGCLMTQSELYADRIKRLKDFGREQGGVDTHKTFGINSKFTDLQAIAGLNQLKDVGHRITKKKVIYHSYQKRLKDFAGFVRTDLNVTVPWFVDIYVNDRDALAYSLELQGIATRFVYPPVNEQAFINNNEEFPISKRASERGLWLPCSVDITTKEIEFVCDKIKEFYK